MITSPHNDKLKEIRKLASGAARERAGGSSPRARICSRPPTPPAGAGRALCAAGSGLRGRRGRAGAAGAASRRWARARARSASTSSAGRRAPAGPLCVYAARRRAIPATSARCCARRWRSAPRSVALGPRTAPTRSARRRCGRRWARSSRCRSRASRAWRELPGRDDRARRAARASRCAAPARRRTLTLVVGAEREGLPDGGPRGRATRVAHIPIAERLAERRDGGHRRAVRGDTRMAAPHDRAGSTQLRSRGRGARSPPPTTTAALEERARRVPRPQGRAAEPAARRRRSCRPSSAARSARPPTQARQALEAADRAARAASSRRASSTRGSSADRVDVTLPGAPAAARRAPAPDHRRRGARSRTSSSASASTSPRGPRSRPSTTTSTRSTTTPTHPARLTHRHLLRRRRRRACCARTPRRCRSARWSSSRRRSTSSSRAASTGRDNDATHTPQFHQVEGLAVDEDITLADLKGTLLAFARAIFGDEREVRLRPHFFPFTEPSVEVDVSCFNCSGTGSPARRLALPALQGRGLDRDPRRRDGRPERVRLRARARLRPRAASRASRSGMGIERIAMLKHGVPDLRLFYDNDVRFLEQFG